MVSARVTIKNASGLHLRPTGVLCEESIKYKSKIHFQFRNSNYNAKSVLSVLGACVKSGDEVVFTCEGEDEEEAMAAIKRVVEAGLGE